MVLPRPEKRRTPHPEFQGTAPAAYRIEEVVVLLTTAPELRENGLWIQEATQTLRPFFKTSFLAGRVGFPVWVSTCRSNSSEEIERRDDTIFSIISGETSGRIGLGGGVIFHQVTIG